MDFIIKRKKQSGNSKCTFQFVHTLSEIHMEDNVLYIERLNHLDYIEAANDMGLQIAIGDVIDSRNHLKDLSLCKGLYYLLMVRKDDSIEIKTDNHSLLPIYYMEQNEETYVSSSFMALTKYVNNKTENPNFYIDLALFHAPLGDDTYLREIKRLQYGEKIIWDNDLQIIRIKRFYDYFVENPQSVKESLSRLSDIFIENSQPYLKDSCAVVLTGGFDGRALTGCAHYYNTDFISFSFGRRGNGDVENPLFLANKLGLKYHLVELEEEYVQNHYYQSVKDSLFLSGGLSGFQSPHSLYCVKEMAKHRSIHVVGYLGSEVFANIKKGNDEITSQSVIDSVSDGINKNNYAYSIYDTLKQLNLVNEIVDIDKALERLHRYIQSLPKNLTQNQKLSVHLFECIVRSTFGVWATNGMHYAKIRLPFVDDTFFSVLATTKLSSFYRAFLDNNLYRRMDGQRLYPEILKKTWPALNTLMSSKGYAPSDITSRIGIYKLMMSKYFSINPYKEKLLDNRSTIAGANHYLKNDINWNNGVRNQIYNILGNNLMLNSLVYWALSKKEFKNILK